MLLGSWWSEIIDQGTDLISQGLGIYSKAFTNPKEAMEDTMDLANKLNDMKEQVLQPDE